MAYWRNQINSAVEIYLLSMCCISCLVSITNTCCLCDQMASSFSFLPVPPNGLVVYCGTIVTEEGKEKKVNIDFEPFKPINTSLYLCDNKFHTEVRAVALCLFANLSDGEWRISFSILPNPCCASLSSPLLSFSHSPKPRHWRPCSLTTASLGLSWSTVAGPCLEHCRATPGRCCTNSPWTCPRSTVMIQNTKICWTLNPQLFHLEKTNELLCSKRCWQHHSLYPVFKHITDN